MPPITYWVISVIFFILAGVFVLPAQGVQNSLKIKPRLAKSFLTIGLIGGVIFFFLPLFIC